MQLNPRPELPASLFSRPLKHARYVAVLIVGSLLVCGRGAFHRRLSSIGLSRDELPPDFEKHNGPNFDQGEFSKAKARAFPVIGVVAVVGRARFVAGCYR